MEYFSYCNIPPRCWLSFCVNPMSKESPLLFSIKSKIFPNDLVQVGLTLSSFLDAQFAQEQSSVDATPAPEEKFHAGAGGGREGGSPESGYFWSTPEYSQSSPVRVR